MLEGSTIVIAFSGTVAESVGEQILPVAGVFDFIDRLVNTAYCKIVLYITNIERKKDIEEWLMAYHHPMLTYLSINSVIVSDIIPKHAAFISQRAIRFTNWVDMERYFI
jgi:hypothetical protein